MIHSKTKYTTVKEYVCPRGTSARGVLLGSSLIELPTHSMLSQRKTLGKLVMSWALGRQANRLGTDIMDRDERTNIQYNL